MIDIIPVCNILSDLNCFIMLNILVINFKENRAFGLNHYLRPRLKDNQRINLPGCQTNLHSVREAPFKSRKCVCHSP